MSSGGKNLIIQYYDEIPLPKCALDNEEAPSGVKRPWREADYSNHPVPRLRMCGANPPLPRVPSWLALGRLYFVPQKVILIRCNDVCVQPWASKVADGPSTHRVYLAGYLLSSEIGGVLMLLCF